MCGTEGEGCEEGGRAVARGGASLFRVGEGCEPELEIRRDWDG